MSNPDMTTDEVAETQEWLTAKYRRRAECIAAIIKLAKLKGERIDGETERVLGEQTDDVLEKTLITYL